MKRTILLGVVCTLLLIAGILTGCGARVENAGEDTNKDAKSMFVCVETALHWEIVYHRETKVMYAVSLGAYNIGTFTLLVNPDGTPMLWEDNNNND